MTQETRANKKPPKATQTIRWLSSLVGFLVLLLGLSIYANRTLWQRARDHYIGVNATRLNPVGLTSFINSEVPAKSEQIRVIFYGDSRAAVWPIPILKGSSLEEPEEKREEKRGKEREYPEKSALETVPIAGYEFINRGLGSQTSIQALQRFQAQISPLQPDVVVIQVGINDIKAIGLFPNQTQKILSDVRTHIEQLVIQAEATGAVVILSSIFPIGKVPLSRRFSLRSYPFWLSDAIEPAIVDVNQYLKEITKADNKNSVKSKSIWFDSYAILANEQGQIKQEYLADELHLNEQGYEVLNQALAETLIEVSKTLTQDDKVPTANQN